MTACPTSSSPCQEQLERDSQILRSAGFIPDREPLAFSLDGGNGFLRLNQRADGWALLELQFAQQNDLVAIIDHSNQQLRQALERLNGHRAQMIVEVEFVGPWALPGTGDKTLSAYLARLGADVDWQLGDPLAVSPRSPSLVMAELFSEQLLASQTSSLAELLSQPQGREALDCLASNSQRPLYIGLPLDQLLQIKAPQSEDTDEGAIAL